MTGALDTKMRELAVTLIDRFGKSVTWTKYASTPTPSTGVVTRTGTSYTATITPPLQYDPSTGRTGSQFNAGALTSTGYCIVTLAASGLSFTPANGDELTIDSATWRVVAVQAVYSGSLVAAYTAQIRR